MPVSGLTFAGIPAWEKKRKQRTGDGKEKEIGITGYSYVKEWEPQISEL